MSAFFPLRARRPADDRPPAVRLLLLALPAAALAAVVLGPDLPLLLRTADGYDPERMVFVHATLPRVAMAILCGGALGASGALLQQALRNPLASPTTLGIDAGARLALAVTTLFAPALFGWGRDAVALAGSGAAAALVFALSRRQSFAPVALILSGLLVSLYCGALAAAFTLVESRYLASLFVWGAGSLSQLSWEPAEDLALRLALVAPAVALLASPLGLLDLGDDAAGALGLPVAALRLGATAAAVLLGAFTASAVGVIGFVGLVAPLLARLAGARRFVDRLVAGTLLGALLLVTTDLAVQAFAGATADFLPTGAVTALLGSPLLLWLLPKVTTTLAPPGAAAPALPRRPAPPTRRALLVAGGALLLAVVVALLAERAPDGAWRLLAADDAAALLPFRWPRVLAAAVAGLLLGAAGFLLQRLTGNEMASPEIIGVSAGATFAMAAALFLVAAPDPATVTGAAAAGAGAVLVLVLWLGRRSGFRPERLLLAGIALSAVLDAVVGVLAATGDPRALRLLSWLTGAGAGLGAPTVVGAAALALPLLAGAAALTRWLALLEAGAPAAVGLGLPLARARALVLMTAAGATAVATPLVGPLTFVGFLAPHMARLAGVRATGPALAASALAGAVVLVAADWAARTAVFPFQLPTGLTASLVGAPLLLWLLERRAR